MIDEDTGREVFGRHEFVHEEDKAGYDGFVPTWDDLPGKPARVATEAARRSYLGLVIPGGFHLHHICGNNWCQNPNHLIAVSPDDHRKIHGKESFCER